MTRGSLSRGCLSWGVSVLGGYLSRGSLSRGVSVQGGLCPGGLCPGVSGQGSLSGESIVQGGLCLGECLPRGVSVQGDLCPGRISVQGVFVREIPRRETPCAVMSRWYTSYWNAFLYDLFLQGRGGGAWSLAHLDPILCFRHSECFKLTFLIKERIHY